jgi:hypothetical protein
LIFEILNPFLICHLPFSIFHLPFAICHLSFERMPAAWGLLPTSPAAKLNRDQAGAGETSSSMTNGKWKMENGK